jgi:hypothetical protein
MTSNAPQGPGWWQASDGNLYPPEQHPSDTAPPAPAPGGPPQSWAPPPLPPPAAPQYPAPAGYSAPGGQTFGNAQAAFTAGLGTVPLAAWLLVGGFVVAVISLFFPLMTISGNGVSVGVSAWKASAGVTGFFILLLAAGAVLSVRTFTQPQSQRGTLIGLTVVIGLLAIHLIYNWLTYDSQIAAAKRGDPDLAGLSASPAFGLFLYTAAIGFLVVRVVLLWTGRSKAQPRAF